MLLSNTAESSDITGEDKSRVQKEMPAMMMKTFQSISSADHVEWNLIVLGICKDT
jgi:hypothetical protein